MVREDTNQGGAFFSKYLLDKNSISYMAYKEKDVFEHYLNKVLNDEGVVFDTSLQCDSTRNYKTVSTTSIIQKKFP